MSDLPITEYRTRNYPNPYIDTNHIVTQIEDGLNGPYEAPDWNGNSRHAEWQELRRQVLERDRYTCQTCQNINKLEIHHVKARREGGTDDPANLITLCEECHIRSDAYRAQFA